MSTSACQALLRVLSKFSGLYSDDALASEAPGVCVNQQTDTPRGPEHRTYTTEDAFAKMLEEAKAAHADFFAAYEPLIEELTGYRHDTVFDE